MVTVKVLAKEDGNIRNNHRNQLRRELGPTETVYDGGTDGGTVRCLQCGKCYDWWPTDERFPDGFTKIRIVPAR